MIEYNYLENQSLEQLNAVGLNDWEIIGLMVDAGPSPHTFDAFAKRGRQGYSIIEADSQTAFYIDKSFNLGNSIIIIFATIFIFAIISKTIYSWLFKND